MAIELQPATSPLDIPSPKPSEIARHWPDKMWCQGHARCVYPDGTVQMCAEGILHELSGEPWTDGVLHDDGVRYWTALASCPFGLGFGQIAHLQYVNDHDGKEAAANLIATWGL